MSVKAKYNKPKKPATNKKGQHQREARPKVTNKQKILQKAMGYARLCDTPKAQM